MEEIHIRNLENDLARRYGTEATLFSREVALDFKYIEFRAGGRFIGGPITLSTGEFLIHELADNDTRQAIFNSEYDLGNSTILTSQQVRQKQVLMALGNYYAKVPSDVFPPVYTDPESLLKELKKVVLDLTGITFSRYKGINVDSSNVTLNGSYATKVLFTVYRYRRKWPKVFNRYRSPMISAKANLELRDCYPLPGFKDIPTLGVEVFADLKASLSHGMTASEREALFPTLEAISLRYANSSYTGVGERIDGDDNEPISLLRSAREIEQLLHLGAKNLPERLDKSMYVALVLRESEHRTVGKQYLNDYLCSPEAHLPRMSNWSIAKCADILQSIPKRDVLGFRNGIRGLTGHAYADAEFSRANELHKKLAWVVKSPLSAGAHFTRMESLAATIACLGDELDKSECQASWYGKKTSSNRPTFFLQSIGDFRDLERVPEFYLEYWFRRYMLVLARLTGTEPMWHASNKLSAIASKKCLRRTIFRRLAR